MIAVNAPLLGTRELEYVTDSIKSGRISSAGLYIEEFEENGLTYRPRYLEKARSLRNLCFRPKDVSIIPSSVTIFG